MEIIHDDEALEVGETKMDELEEIQHQMVLRELTIHKHDYLLMDCVVKERTDDRYVSLPDMIIDIRL